MAKLAANLFFVAGALFLVVAFMPIIRSTGSVDATFLALGVVFLVVGIANLKKSRSA